MLVIIEPKNLYDGTKISSGEYGIFSNFTAFILFGLLQIKVLTKVLGLKSKVLGLKVLRS